MQSLAYKICVMRIVYNIKRILPRRYEDSVAEVCYGRISFCNSGYSKIPASHINYVHEQAFSCSGQRVISLPLLLSIAEKSVPKKWKGH